MESFLLYFFSACLLGTAFKTVTCRNPAYGALYLALSMILLAFIFFLMSAPFLAGVQLIIYAGAVIVLFVMVLMLFDLKKESLLLFNSRAWIWPVFLFGIFSGLIALSSFSSAPQKTKVSFLSVKSIALKLFTDYILIFEMIGLLLLVIAIAATALSRLDKDAHL